jgi:hypothetical protein
MQIEPKKEEKVTTKPKREAGMMTTIGFQGVGKTYQNMQVISNYIKDNPAKRVMGRKVLILDTNGEYTQEQFRKNNIPNFTIKTIAVRDIEAFGQAPIAECRRIDAKHLSIKDKKRIIQYIIRVYRNGMLVLEDINTYILSMTHMEEIVGGLVNLRHRAVDVLISYQRLRAVEPIILANSRWIRMHYQADSINDVKGKISNPILFRIAQLIVDEKYFNGSFSNGVEGQEADERFFLYIYNSKLKIAGAFTREEYYEASKKYLNSTKKLIKECMDMYGFGKDEAIRKLQDQYYKQYYGNNDKINIKIGQGVKQEEKIKPKQKMPQTQGLGKP